MNKQSVWTGMAGSEKHKFLGVSLIPYSHFVCYTVLYCRVPGVYLCLVGF